MDKRGLRKNLLVVFVVDNGWVQSTGPAKKGDQFDDAPKNTPYDAGVRTPVILHWPGHTKAGSYEDLVSTVDLAPTILRGVRRQGAGDDGRREPARHRGGQGAR